MKNYRDKYYAKGHWGVKIWQTLIMLLSWVALFIPIVITVSTYLAYCSHGRYGHFFWHYSEGFQELNFLVVFLLFALGTIAVFCLTMAYVQVQRSRGLVDKWPMFDMLKNQRERKAAEAFMTKRFGPEKHRQRVRRFSVKPEQNLNKNQLRDVINGQGGEDNHGF